MRFHLNLFALVFALAATAAAQADPVSFKKDISPILLDNCLACHGPKKAEGGYRIDTYERVMALGCGFAVESTFLRSCATRRWCIRRCGDRLSRAHRAHVCQDEAGDHDDEPGHEPFGDRFVEQQGCQRDGEERIEIDVECGLSW